MIRGTSYFVSFEAATLYYRLYGFNANDVHRKLLAGEIHIGKPLIVPGQRLSIIDSGTRYAIERKMSMPEFVLNIAPETQARYDALDDFTKGYIEAMFFCGVEGLGFDALDTGSLHESVWKAVETDCAAFQLANAAALSAATSATVPRKYQREIYTMRTAGVDYWFTRNGHGAGYWDRSLPDDVERELTRAATMAGQRTLYVGDDRYIYGA